MYGDTRSIKTVQQADRVLNCERWGSSDEYAQQTSSV
jgi:predicted GTPase